MFDRLRVDAERWGWARSFYMRVMRYVRTYLGLHIFLIRTRPLVEDRPDPPVLPPGVALRILGRDELFAATKDPELGISDDFVCAALGRGDTAFGAIEGDAVVAYTWRARNAAPLGDGLWVKVDRPYRYGYKAFTRPSHRGLRLSPAISLFSDADGLKSGYTHSIAYIETSNWATLAAGKRKGYSAIGLAGYLKWFRLCVAFRTPAVRKVGLEFFRPAT